MTAPVGPRGPEPALEDLPPDAPATVEDVRAARRWTMVALAWAVAASAIALFALMSQDDDDPAPPPAPPDNTARIQRLERTTDQRLDAFERRIGARASEDDIQKLERRLRAMEDDADQAKTDAAGAKSTNSEQAEALDALEQRVEDLEDAENQPGGGGEQP